MKYLAVLGRQPELSMAELEALFNDVRQVSEILAEFSSDEAVEVSRLGGTLKLAVPLETKPLEYLSTLPDGKITLGLSDYSPRASKKTATLEALKLKKILTRHGRSVRMVPGAAATLATASSLHNGLSGKNPRKVELLKFGEQFYRVVGVQDIDSYTARDQARPARDAKVGMLPPKLAQILINLAGPLAKNAQILDPFCGTGVVLQEALLMGYRVYGTDLNVRMVDYSARNLNWLHEKFLKNSKNPDFLVEQGDATSHQWAIPVDAVVAEAYLGQPMSLPPAEIKLKTEKANCRSILLGFLKNLAPQIAENTPVVVAVPAWLRPDGSYSRLEILDEIERLGYNVHNKSREGLLYHREAQVVARDIIILRKK